MFWGIIMILILLMLAGIVFCIVMIVHAARHDIKNKAIWIIMMVVTGWLGAIVYYFVIKRSFMSGAMPSAAVQYVQQERNQETGPRNFLSSNTLLVVFLCLILLPIVRIFSNNVAFLGWHVTFIRQHYIFFNYCFKLVLPITLFVIPALYHIAYCWFVRRRFPFLFVFICVGIAFVAFFTLAFMSGIAH